MCKVTRNPPFGFTETVVISHPPAIRFRGAIQFRQSLPGGFVLTRLWSLTDRLPDCRLLQSYPRTSFVRRSLETCSPTTAAAFPMDLLNPTIRWDWTGPSSGGLGLLGGLGNAALAAGSRGRNHRLRCFLAVLVILPQPCLDCGFPGFRHRLTRT